VQGNTGETAQIVSALSHHFRKLDGVSVTDTEPALRIQCLVEAATGRASKMQLGYVSSVAAFSIDGRFFAQWVVADSALTNLRMILLSALKVA